MGRLEGAYEQTSDRLNGIDRRLDGIDRRLDSFEQRVELRFSQMDQRFLWVIGLVVASWVSTMGTLSAVLALLLHR